MKISINTHKLRQKAADVRQALLRLAPVKGLTLEEFLADEQRVAASKYYLIMATEAAIDICNHLVARLTGRAPNSYADCFNILLEERFLSSGLAERLTQMAKFRNLLIHRYGDIDDRQVYHIICNSLDDLELYLAEIAAVARCEL